MAKPFFLLSNDDGVHAPGIRALAEAVDPLGDWMIVAPHVERSGSGQALSLTTPLRVERLESNIYAVEGTPTDCVMFAINKLLDRRPDFVVSGINRGSNVGQDTLYSGTVAAAMEGCLHGIPAIAASLRGRHFERSDYADAVKVMRMILQNRDLLEPARKAVLNVNIPDVPLNQMAGFSMARLGRRIYDTQIVENKDPRGRPYYWIGGGGEDSEHIPGSDCNLLAEQHVTLSVLTPDHVDTAANEVMRTGLAGKLNLSIRSAR